MPGDASMDSHLVSLPYTTAPFSFRICKVFSLSRTEVGLLEVFKVFLYFWSDPLDFTYNLSMLSTLTISHLQHHNSLRRPDRFNSELC